MKAFSANFLMCIRCFCITAFMCCAARAEEREKDFASRSKQERNQLTQEYIKAAEIAKDLSTWLSAMDKCDTLATALGLETDATVEGIMISAKVSMLEGRYSSALKALRLLDKRDDNLTAPGMNMRLRTLVDLWEGTLSRYIGDFSGAHKVLTATLGQEAPKGKEIIDILCHLYLSEIYLNIRNDIPNGKKELEAAALVQTPKGGEWDKIVQIYHNFVSYELLRLEKGSIAAGLALEDYPGGGGSVDLLAETQLSVNGIMNEPRIGFNDDPKIDERALILSVETEISPLDRALAQMCLSRIYWEQRNWPLVERYASELFASDSYFAAEGAFILIKMKKSQGGLKGVQDTAKIIINRFPKLQTRVEKELAGPPASQRSEGIAPNP